jgi:hypothetical protein
MVPASAFWWNRRDGDGGKMALEGPRIVYTRKEDETADVLSRALSVARELESLLEKTAVAGAARELRGANATRIVRAMAASLVDELEALVRGTRKNGVS